MDSRVLDIIDQVLNKYLSYSKEELDVIASRNEISFWEAIFLKLGVGESYRLTDTFMSNSFTAPELLYKLDDLIINSYSKFASNDDFYEMFEVAA